MSNGPARRYVPASAFESLEDARKSLREESLIALEKQGELVEFLDSQRSEDFFRGFIGSYGYRNFQGHVDETTLARWLRGKVRRTVSESPVYFVSRDMTEMIKMASEEMPREGITPADMLTGDGFLYFHHPIEVVGPAGTEEDLAGLDDYNLAPVSGTEIVGLRAIAWTQDENVGRPDGTSAPGISYYLFFDPEHVMRWRVDAETDELVEAMRAAGQELPEPIAAIVPDDVLRDIRRETLRQVGPLVLYDYSGWIYGSDWEVVPYDEAPRPMDTPPAVHPVVDQVRRILVTTWRMLSQKIVSLETQRPPRALRRRVSRIIPESGDVTVIRLRREYHPGGSEEEALLEEGESWYNHRFLVRGHWRRQPYGEGKGQTKLIWIAPYIKGPEDGPLVVKDRIYSLEH